MDGYAVRVASGIAIIVTMVVSGACSSPSAAVQGSSLSTTAAVADCVVQTSGPSRIDSVFADIPGYTVRKVCPTDIASPFADADVLNAAAGEVKDNANTVLTVFAGELKSGSGDAFIHMFLSGLQPRNNDPAKAVATENELLGGSQVTYFNVPLGAQGYAYAQGPVVVIAYVGLESPPGAPKDAFTKLLANLH
jgi:hypothetical protein